MRFSLVSLVLLSYLPNNCISQDLFSADEATTTSTSSNDEELEAVPLQELITPPAAEFVFAEASGFNECQFDTDCPPTAIAIHRYCSKGKCYNVGDLPIVHAVEKDATGDGGDDPPLDNVEISLVGAGNTGDSCETASDCNDSDGSQICLDGICETNQISVTLADDECNGCLEGQSCIGGQCIALPEIFSIPPGAAADLCQGNPCKVNQVCSGGVCFDLIILPPDLLEFFEVSDLCQGNPCNEGEYCANGQCLGTYTVIETELAPGFINNDRCNGVACGANQVCSNERCATVLERPVDFDEVVNESINGGRCGGTSCSGENQVCFSDRCLESLPLATVTLDLVGNDDTNCEGDADCGVVQICLSGNCVDSGVAVQGTTVWYEAVKQNFVGTRLKRCHKRGDTPPTEGTGCAARPKTCFFGYQGCGNSQYPDTRCFCDGKEGSQTWSCTPVSCPATDNVPIF